MDTQKIEDEHFIKQFVAEGDGTLDFSPPAENSNDNFRCETLCAIIT